jgi:hypothetical protein
MGGPLALAEGATHRRRILTVNRNATIPNTSPRQVFFELKKINSAHYIPAMCPVAQASATACVSMIAPRALFTMITPLFILAILSLSNRPLMYKSNNQ